MAARDLYALHGMPAAIRGGAVARRPTPAGPRTPGSYAKFFLAVFLVGVAALGTTFVDSLVFGPSEADAGRRPAVVAPAEPLVTEEPIAQPDEGLATDALVDSPETEPVANPTEPETTAAEPAPVAEKATTARPRKAAAQPPVARPAPRPRRRALTPAQREEQAKQAAKARKKRLKELEKARKEREKRRRN
jgi:hypothetical protein